MQKYINKHVQNTQTVCAEYVFFYVKTTGTQRLKCYSYYRNYVTTYLDFKSVILLCGTSLA